MFNYYVTLTNGQRPSFKHFLQGGNHEIAIDDKFLQNKLQCLHLYKIFYEAGDHQICKIIEKKYNNKEIDLERIALSFNNLEDVITLLTCSPCANWKDLNLGRCYIQDKGVRMLHHSLQCKDITIEVLFQQYPEVTEYGC